MNRNFITALAALSAFVLSAAPLMALPGLSPVWERYFNHNQPFDAANPDHAPGADPDGDGWDNVEESTAGTSPWDPNPPGIILPVIDYYSEVSAIAIQWGPTQIGKRYRLMMSTTLEAGSWSTVGDSIPGHGGDARINLTLTDAEGIPQPRAFFRVVVDDLPSASAGTSGRTQWDDHMLATHPEIPDDSAPSTPGPGNDPDPDSDGDGLTNSQDAVKNDPLIRFERVPEGKFIWIPVENAGGLSVIDMNDKGQLLYQAPRPDLPDLPTQPVAKIWDPAQPAQSRWSDVFFNPSPSFKINAFRYTGPEPEFFVHDVPFPFPQSDLIGYSIHFQFRYLGDDGSILANAGFNFSERRDLETSIMAGGSDHLVFLWKGSNRTSPILFGQDRGISQDQSRETRNGAVGFFTDRSGPAPVVKALVLDQDQVYSTGIPVSDLFLKVMPTNSTSITSYLLKHDREMSPDPIGAAYLGTTHGGRFLLQHSRQLNGPPYWERSFVAASATGAASPVNIPYHSYETVLDFPTGQWGTGSSYLPVHLTQGDNNLLPTTITGVLQFDRQGTGIGDGRNNLGVWRNGRWQTLRQATGRDDLPTDVKPKKITASGLIWASNDSGTSNGVMMPIAVNSMDRYVAGSVPLSLIESLGGESKFGMVFRRPGSGEEYRFARLSEAHVYSDPFTSEEEGEDLILSNSEIAVWADGPNGSARELNQEVVFYRKDGRLHFRALFDQAGPIEIGLLVDGHELGAAKHRLTPDADIGDLLETIDSILGGTHEDPGGIPALAARAGVSPEDVALLRSAALQMQHASPQARASFFGFIRRNLTIKVNIPTWEAVKNEFQEGVRIAGESTSRLIAFVALSGKGFCEGAWFGIKDDVLSLVELGKMALNPSETAKIFYEGFRVLIKLDANGWKNVGKSLVKSFVEKGEEGVNGWAEPSTYNVACYLFGFTAGYITEQIVVTYVTAGVLKAGNIGARVGEFIRKAARGIVAPLAEGLALVRKQAMKTKNALFRTLSQNVLTPEEVQFLKRTLQEIELLCPIS